MPDIDIPGLAAHVGATTALRQSVGLQGIYDVGVAHAMNVAKRSVTVKDEARSTETLRRYIQTGAELGVPLNPQQPGTGPSTGPHPQGPQPPSPTPSPMHAGHNGNGNGNRRVGHA